MSTTQLSRRQFLASGGALTVGFSLTASPPDAAAAATPGSLAQDAWLTVCGQRFGPSGAAVIVYAGKVELGTGIQTALTQLVAEELNVTMSQVAYVQGDTSLTPGSQGYTAGSKSVQTDGPSMRKAAAAAMQQLFALASTLLGVPVTGLKASAGRIGVGATMTPSLSYKDIIGSASYALTTPSGQTTKAYTDFTLVGTPVPRTDLPGKFTARFQYAADIKLPGMVHARVIRPTGRNATLASVDASPAAGVPGFLQVVQQGNFVAVVASDEYAAVSAAALVKTTWNSGAAFMPQATLPTALQDTVNNVYATDYEVNKGDFDTQYPLTGQQLQATYFTPFYMHGTMGAGAAVADVKANSATVYSGTQGPYPLRAALVPLLGLPYANIRVIYSEGSGCYGHNGVDDVSAEAALISKLCGKPVRLQWTRAEEHRWEPLSSAMVHIMRGGVTGSTVVAWEHRLFSASHNSRPNGAALAGGAGSEGNLLPAQLALGTLPADAPALGANTASRNAPVIYTFANNRLQRNWVKSFNLVTGTRKAATPLTWVLPRTTALRSLGGFSNSFANESFMDELATAAGADPVAFRIAHLSAASDQRGIDVINAAWAQASTQAVPAAPAGYKSGRGIAFQRYEVVETYVAVVADVLVSLSTGAVSVKRVVVAHDCGQIVNPDGLRNQIEGNVLQGISRTLKEQVDYTADRILNNAWVDFAAFGQVSYPVIQFNELPTIETVLIDHPETVSWGAGEPTIGAVPAAIANALFRATAQRFRTLPLRPATVLAGLNSLTATTPRPRK